MARSRRISDPDTKKIVAGLHELYPDADCELRYEDPLQLLVATILSAQSTDQRVNQVTESLFRKYRTAEDYAAADPEVFEQEIRSTGFYRNKTKSVLGAAKRLVAEYGGEVPASMADLVTLPGVARKTANVVLGTAFGKAEGVVVDTHVKRLAYRLGLSLETEPEKIERDLMARLPRRRVGLRRPRADPARPARLSRQQAGMRHLRARRMVPAQRGHRDGLKEAAPTAPRLERPARGRKVGKSISRRACPRRRAATRPARGAAGRGSPRRRSSRRSASGRTARGRAPSRGG